MTTTNFYNTSFTGDLTGAGLSLPRHQGGPLSTAVVLPDKVPKEFGGSVVPMTPHTYNTAHQPTATLAQNETPPPNQNIQKTPTNSQTTANTQITNAHTLKNTKNQHVTSRNTRANITLATLNIKECMSTSLGPEDISK